MFTKTHVLIVLTEIGKLYRPLDKCKEKANITLRDGVLKIF